MPNPHRGRRSATTSPIFAHVERPPSSISGVSLPVKVFCWLTWYEPSNVRPSADPYLGSVAEPRPGPQPVVRTHRVPSVLSECDDDPYRVAVPALARGTDGTCHARLVWACSGRRRALDRRGDEAVRRARVRRRGVRSSAGWRSPCGAATREQEVARPITGEDPAGPVAAMCCRRQSDDRRARSVRVAESREQVWPSSPTNESAPPCPPPPARARRPDAGTHGRRPPPARAA